MMMSALLAKKLANDSLNLEVFYSFIAHNYPRFMEGYGVWEKNVKLKEGTLDLSKIKE